MTTPVAEDDLVERLREKIIADAFETGLITSGAFAERLIKEREDAVATIERLQDALSVIRSQVINECAKLAETHIASLGYTADRAFYGTAASEEIAKAIRSIDGGGK